MKNKIFLVFAILLGLFNCKSQSQDDSLQFNVDKSLLDQEYLIDSLNFSFSPPTGWVSDSSKTINIQTQKFQNEELNSYIIHINEIFYDSSSSNFCSISLIESSDSLNFDYFISNFNSIISNQLNPDDIKKGQFSRNNLEIIQFLMMTEKTVFFKLFFQTTPKYILQLDYAIDRNKYPYYIKKIESSIGSITTI